LEGNDQEKKKNIDIIKKAYNVRSLYVHGQILKSAKFERVENDRKELISLSQDVDNLIRQVLLKAIEEPLFQTEENDVTNWINNSFQLSKKNTFKSTAFISPIYPDKDLKIYTHDFDTCQKSFIAEFPPKVCPYCKRPAEEIIL